MESDPFPEVGIILHAGFERKNWTVLETLVSYASSD
jgi:hypothetical protein